MNDHNAMRNNHINEHNHGMNVKETNPFITVGQVLTIVGAVIWCFSIIGMIWGIPMIIGSMKRLNHTKKITIMHIVITILFYFMIGGVLTLFGAYQEKSI